MGSYPDWITSAPLIAVAAVLALWMAGAIYYDVCRGTRWGKLLAAGWVGCVAVLFATWQPLWQPFSVLLGVTAHFLLWGLRLKPSQNRDWDPCVAVLARAIRDGDTITIENVRNFEYRSLQDYTIRYENRTYRLSNLLGVDIIFFNWGVALMSHPVLVFDFGLDGRVCMSIEVRFRRGQRFSITRSLYRQQELIFLAADERDAILRRTKHGRPQQAHLYRFNASPDELRTAFLDYIGAINGLYAPPLVPWAVRELHNVVLPASQQPGPARLAGARQRPAGPGPLRTRAAGPHRALSRAPAERVPERRREQRPRRGVRGPHPPRTGEAPL